jgi:hypothetical protein
MLEPPPSDAIALARDGWHKDGSTSFAPLRESIFSSPRLRASA